MTSMLATLDRPICMIGKHVATQATTLRIKHHTKGGFAATDVSTSKTLFNVDSRKGLGPRRVFHDADGQTILEMRRHLTGNETYVGVPNDNALPAAIIAPRATLLKDKVDVYVKDAGQEIRLEVRGQDNWKRNTYVYYGDKLVMQVRFVNYATSYVPFSSNQWDVSVAEGMDLLLVSLLSSPSTSAVLSDQQQATTIVVYLATTLYDGSKFQSDYGQDGKETSNTRKWVTMGAVLGAGAGGGAGAG